MLPFLKQKQHQAPGIAMEIRKPDQESSEDHAMLAAAKDIMDAISAGDHKRLAAAFRAAFEILELEPHDEVSHEE